MAEVTGPHQDPSLQTPEMREIVWALESVAAGEIDSTRSAAIWREVKRRAATIEAGGHRTWSSGVNETIARRWREVIATVMPEALTPSPAVRSTDIAVPTLMVYETDEFSISVTFTGTPESPRIKLLGHVVPKKESSLPAGGRVAVWSESETGFADLDAQGEFALENVPRGELHMDIVLGGDAIQISPIHTRAPRVPGED